MRTTQSRTDTVGRVELDRKAREYAATRKANQTALERESDEAERLRLKEMLNVFP